MALPVSPHLGNGVAQRHLLTGGGGDAAAMGIQGGKAPGVGHGHVAAQLAAVSHRRDGAVGEAGDDGAGVGGDVRAVVEGVLPPAEAVGDSPLYRGGVGKAQHLLGQAYVLRGVLRRVGGCGGLGLPGAEHRRIGVVQCAGQGTVKGVAHGGKGGREVRVAAHQRQ